MSKDRPGSADKSALSFEELELAVMDEMCELFKAGKGFGVYPHELRRQFGVDEQRAGTLFARLKGLGAIIEVRDSMAGLLGGQVGGSGMRSVVGPGICDVVAERRAAIAEKSRPADRVDATYRWARSHAILSLAIIGLLVLTALVTLINQSLQVVERIWGVAPTHSQETAPDNAAEHAKPPETPR